MKSAVSLVIVACFIASPSAGCATGRGPRQLDEVVPDSGPPISSWSRVSELVHAAEIVVTTKDSRQAARHFVMANESAVIVLNLTAPTLPAVSRRVLRDMASQHPEYFAAMQTTGAFQQDNVRVGRDGLFVAGRKVADVEEVVETIARDEVSEIRGPVVARGSVVGTVLGGWLGFAVGAVPGLGGAPEAAAWFVLIGSVAVGGYLGFHWSSHETEGIVYKAP